MMWRVFRNWQMDGLICTTVFLFSWLLISAAFIWLLMSLPGNVKFRRRKQNHTGEVTRIANFKIQHGRWLPLWNWAAAHQISMKFGMLMRILIPRVVTHSFLMAIFPGEPGLAGWPLNSPSTFIPELRILLGFYQSTLAGGCLP